MLCLPLYNLRYYINSPTISAGRCLLVLAKFHCFLAYFFKSNRLNSLKKVEDTEISGVDASSVFVDAFPNGKITFNTNFFNRKVHYHPRWERALLRMSKKPPPWHKKMRD